MFWSQLYFFKGELSKLLFPLKKFILLFSEETLNEFIKVLHYPKFLLTKDEIEYLLQFEILPYSKIVEVTFKFDKEICPDKDDQKFFRVSSFS